VTEIEWRNSQKSNDDICSPLCLLFLKWLDGKKDREEERRSERKRDVKRAGGKNRYETRRTGRRGELP